tara:strand:+ start:1265 stop:1882 length:618 start_codon:yes stop_codon:yes gene_type:complete
MSLISPNVPEGFEIVNGIGPHLQIQFIEKVNGKIYSKKEAFIFKNKIKTIDDLEDLNIYPVSKDYLEIPKNTIGILIYGLQYEYETKEEIMNMYIENRREWDDRYDTYPGIKVSTDYQPNFIKFGIDSKLEFNENIKKFNSHLFVKINFNENGIESIKLKESLTKVHSYHEEYVKVVAQEYIKQEERKQAIEKVKNDLKKKETID